MLDYLTKKLTSDFTLFNLCDPETTKFYIKNMDYLITNFPYFRDIAMVSSYFLSENKRFNAKFQTRITKFLEIVEYDSRLGKDAAYDTLPPKESFMLGEALNSDEEDVKDIFQLSDSEENLVEKFTLSDGEEDDKKPLSPPVDLMGLSLNEPKRSNSLITLRTTPNFPNHFPQGPEFTINSTALVLSFYAKILTIYAGKFVVSYPFVSKLLKKLKHNEIGTLLSSLVIHGTALEILIRNQCFRDICVSNLPVMEMILESCLYSTCNKEGTEDKVLEQLYEQKEYLIDRFLNEGIRAGYIINTQERSCSESAAGDLFSSIFNILLILCNYKSPVNIPEVEICILNRFTLFYLRILSFNTSFSPKTVTGISEIFFGNPTCSHALFSISRIFLKLPVETLIAAGVFEKMRNLIFDYIEAYSIDNNLDSLFAFILKIYTRFRDHLQSESWDTARVYFDYFISQEKFSYRPQDLNAIEEPLGFERYIIDCFLSDIPYSSVFKKDNESG
ncbi:hypothetical protein GINT2_001424 [Glugoides intestinalis]